MKDVDALISDYSSSSYEFLHADKPIGFTIDDVKDFKLEMNFSDPENYMPGHIIHNQKNHTYIKFGVIVSRGKAPKTYHEHAVKYKMLQDVVIIHFTLNEILDMATNKENLLDKMDEKIKNIIIDIDDYKKAIGE